ncbi:sulfate ABC transporter substrate-binding protein [Urbifossiella limnaea]|uniref:Sulfate-binding protein n=1 Tax=Urbifossiella limnaea TaxID=2528023 RepID=A0A517XVK9_9BACT|nr:sulfate ABC transporter substrate-binding protein [Urbifossiella limnaea]QDU21550.1 Sulfate-binding protein precursor [Urbifossiella limnaea]
MWTKFLFAVGGVYLVAAAAWIVSAGVVRDGGGTDLLNVACDPTRELWRDINAAFIRDYAEKKGTTVTVRMSHGGSASQAQAVANGLEADVVTLAMFPDTDMVRKAGLLEAGWEKKLPNRSLPYVSTIVFVVRKGNPKNVRGWADLARDDVSAITPNPKTSGNGKWSFLALWGSVIWSGGTEAEAREYVRGVYSRTPVLDAAARGATMTFASKKIGDVHLTWENEAHLEVDEGHGELEIVYPLSRAGKAMSVLAEPHVALVDKVADRRGTRVAAEAYLNFLYTEPAQELIARHHHRPTLKRVADRHRDHFPDLDLRTATGLVPSGTWDEVLRTYFADGAEFDQMYSRRSK